jgi:hypothetical protein
MSPRIPIPEICVCANPYVKMTEQQIIDQLRTMPESLKQEVSGFIGYLVTKYQTDKAIKKAPRFGSSKDKYTLSDDFDAPLDDLRIQAVRLR